MSAGIKAVGGLDGEHVLGQPTADECLEQRVVGMDDAYVSINVAAWRESGRKAATADLGREESIEPSCKAVS